MKSFAHLARPQKPASAIRHVLHRCLRPLGSLAGGLLLAASAAAADRSPVMQCASLAGFKLADTQILLAAPVAATATLPAYCHVAGVIDARVSAQDPDHFTYGIGFNVNLPERWNGRFEMQGGGGTDGSVNAAVGYAGSELSQGWVVASDDGGHEDAAMAPYGWSDDDAQSGGSAHFAIDERARLDYGYMGIPATTLVARKLMRAYYGQAEAHAYLAGCSNGGRDGMMALQRDPGLFDGVLSGNPGFDLPRAALAEAWNEQALAPLATRQDVNGQPYLPDTFPPQDVAVISAAVLSACDGLDGLVDGIIDNFPACTNARVYPALDAFTCSAGGAHGDVAHGGSCLTSGQVSALKKIMAGPHLADGTALYSGWYWDAGLWTPFSDFGAGFQLWNVGLPGAPTAPLANNAINLTLGAGAIPMVFMTPPDVTPVAGPQGQEAYVFGFDFEQNAQRIFATAPGYGASAMDYMAATRTDLRAFRQRGGKLLITSAIDDGIFSGADIVHWYQEMGRVTGHAQDFARLFMVPNMAHCGGGPGTTVFNANALDALTRWVEQGSAPERIVAANLDQVAPFPGGGIFDPQVAHNFPTGGTRPLCPYPRQPRYQGSGSTASADSFACVAVPDEEAGDGR